MGRRKKKNKLKNSIALIVIFAIVAGMYYYIEVYSSNTGRAYDDETGQSEYIILENTDSSRYQDLVMYNRNVNINNISKTFYKDSQFWPYIFIANCTIPAVRKNPLDIPKGLVLKIPRLKDTEKDPNNPFAVERAIELADSILNLQ